MASSDVRERFLLPRVMEALDDTRIVVLQGARQVGKSTLVEQIATQRDGMVVSLDDPGARVFAASDPTGFVAQSPGRLLVIDEAQRVPELVIALKAAVDRDRHPGRFLVTGSANLLDLAATHESLAGRAQSLVLHSFSQGEVEGVRSSFIDALFEDGPPPRHTSVLGRQDYLERACAGGYPEALARPAGRRRDDWYHAYLAQIVNRDAADVSGLHRIAELPRILRLIAARAGSGMVWSSLAGDSGIPRSTLDPYIKLLETLYLIHTVPAWAARVTAREVKQPKVFLLDTGLAAALLGVTSDGLAPTRPNSPAGGLLEGFVLGELLRQAGWSEQRTSVSHYRDSRGAEVDIVLETPDGRVVAIEVKAAATVQSKDLGGLGLLRDRLGDRFVAGIVLYSGERSQAVGERITAVPIDALWSARAVPGRASPH